MRPVASYVMYFYQDVLGLSATFVGLILMIARVFDALNDPFMGVLVAKTRSRWGRFRPWLISGTVLSAVVLYALFNAPRTEGAGLMAYFAVVYILWGVTYTMMDIPYWSMIPAVTRTPADRENLSVVGRTRAGVGSALIAMFTVLMVGVLGGDSERVGFGRFALIVSVIFVAAEILCRVFFKENSQTRIETAGVKEMFSALARNDQAMVVAASGVAVFLTGVGLDLIGLVGNTDETGPIAVQSPETPLGLRLMMTVLPVVVLAVALALFRSKLTLTDRRMEQIGQELRAREGGNS